MSEFDFFDSEGARALARLTRDTLATEFERLHESCSYAEWHLRAKFLKGELTEVTVTPEVRIRATDLLSGDKTD